MKNEDITFVVQGPVANGRLSTARNLVGLRRLFPGASIILSTWVGTDTSKLTGLCDEILCNEDPGAWDTPGAGKNNINRQICSTRAGLGRVRTPFAAKLRSDCSLAHDGFVGVWEEHARGFVRALFSGPVVAPTMLFRDPEKFPQLFHPSDFFHFGKTSDLVALWDAPPSPRIDTEVFAGRRKPVHYGTYPYIRLAAEQHLWISFLERRGFTVNLPETLFVSRELVELSERSLLENFRWVDHCPLGLLVPDHLLYWHYNECVYTEADQSTLRRLYASGDAVAIRARVDRVLWKALRHRQYAQLEWIRAQLLVPLRIPRRALGALWR